MTNSDQKFTVLSGGVGGAKLVLGLRDILGADALQVVVNTGDDFEHIGLPVCPDIDTLIYTLADQANPETGWGRRDESWHFMDALAALGGDTWFRLGDRDLGTHVRRRELLQNGVTLSAATLQIARVMGVSTPIYPMSDAPVQTLIATATGEISFQDYFVRLHAQPAITGIRYRSESSAAPGPGALQALAADDLTGIIIAPSNPWLSIAPILSVAELKSSILCNKAPVIAVSPIVDGQAIKGPTAKLMDELGIGASVVGIAEYYRNLIDGLVIDQKDKQHRAIIEGMGIQVAVTNTIMNDLQDKTRLAQFVCDFAMTLGQKPGKSPGNAV